MNVRRFFIGEAIGFLVVVLFVGGFFVFNNYIYEEKQAETEVLATPYRATLTGEYLCLPYTNTPSETSTDTDCELGILTDTGEYYAINFYLMSQTHDPIKVGQKISGNGSIQPAENLSSSHWQQYPIEGIFSVTDSLQIIE